MGKKTEKNFLQSADSSKNTLFPDDFLLTFIALSGIILIIKLK